MGVTEHIKPLLPALFSAAKVRMELQHGLSRATYQLKSLLIVKQEPLTTLAVYFDDIWLAGVYAVRFEDLR